MAFNVSSCSGQDFKIINDFEISRSQKHAMLQTVKHTTFLDAGKLPAHARKEIHNACIDYALENMPCLEIHKAGYDVL